MKKLIIILLLCGCCENHGNSILRLSKETLILSNKANSHEKDINSTNYEIKQLKKRIENLENIIKERSIVVKRNKEYM